MEGWWMAEEIKYKAEGNNNGTILLVRYTECESRRYRGNFYVSSSASSTPSLSSSLLFVSNLRDGLTTGSINLLFTFAFALEIARGLF